MPTRMSGSTQPRPIASSAVTSACQSLPANAVAGSNRFCPSCRYSTGYRAPDSSYPGGRYTIRSRGVERKREGKRRWRRRRPSPCAREPNRSVYDTKLRREYIKWHSPSLGRDMELLAYGHAGFPVVVFPTSGGRFFEYEDRGMISALAPKIGRGELQVI